MLAEQHQKHSQDLIYGHVAALAQQQPEFGQEKLWQDCLRGFATVDMRAPHRESAAKNVDQ